MLIYGHILHLENHKDIDIDNGDGDGLDCEGDDNDGGLYF